MGDGGRTDRGRAPPAAERRGAPSPGDELGRYSMSTGIRNLILAWGGPEPRDDDERLAAIRRAAPVITRPVLIELRDAVPERRPE